MTDLPFLLRLIDDPSPLIADKVGARLRAYGPRVWQEIESQNLKMSKEQHLMLEMLLLDTGSLNVDGDPTEQLWQTWRQLGGIGRETQYLEKALFALASWQKGKDVSAHGARLLDRLANEFQAHGDAHDSLALSKFLFEFYGLRGAAPGHFHDAHNSNLVFVLEERVGLPISLACVFILVGARVGLHIEGCNFPGHFLARDGRRQNVFDPYNRGRLLSPREVATLENAAPSEMMRPASAREIVSRVLRNLSVAYHHDGNREHLSLMLSLLRAMDNH